VQEQRMQSTDERHHNVTDHRNARFIPRSHQTACTRLAWLAAPQKLIAVSGDEPVPSFDLHLEG
jgi:hypothetical protein